MYAQSEMSRKAHENRPLSFLLATKTCMLAVVCLHPHTHTHTYSQTRKNTDIFHFCNPGWRPTRNICLRYVYLILICFCPFWLPCKFWTKLVSGPPSTFDLTPINTSKYSTLCTYYRKHNVGTRTELNQQKLFDNGLTKLKVLKSHCTTYRQTCQKVFGWYRLRRWISPKPSKWTYSM